MSAAELRVAPSSPEKLSVVVFSGAFDKVHYALAMAAAALASNRAATLFFTMAGVRALLPEDGDGPGWRRLHPTEDGAPPRTAEAALIEKGLGGFEELLSACVALGGVIMVCEMGLKAQTLTLGDLRKDVPVTAGGLVSFLEDASATGALVFV